MNGVLRETWIGENKITFREDGILELFLSGDIDAQLAVELSEASIRLSGTTTLDTPVLIDINKTGRQSSEARKIFQSYNKKGTNSVAIHGMHPVAKVLAAFFISVIRSDKVKFFITREEALNWLKKTRN